MYRDGQYHHFLTVIDAMLLPGRPAVDAPLCIACKTVVCQHLLAALCYLPAADLSLYNQDII